MCRRREEESFFHIDTRSIFWILLRLIKTEQNLRTLLRDTGFCEVWIDKTVALDLLSEEALKEILVKPKNAITKQYQKLLELDGISLSFEEDAFKRSSPSV